MVSPQARREQVALLCQGGLSQRRACGLIGIARSGLSYVLRQPGKDAPFLQAIRRLSSQYPRYGYQRICIFLRREGHLQGAEHDLRGRLLRILVWIPCRA